MNSVGIDVSKGKSTVTVNCMGEEIVSPFDVDHTVSELSELAKLLKSLDGETRVVMEATGNYYLPIAATLYNAGIFVCVVNPMLLRGYGNSSLRPGKTDKTDARKLARYGLEHWAELLPYAPQENTRALLKTCYRQYQQCAKIQTMLKNNLIALLDVTFPGANRLRKIKKAGRLFWRGFSSDRLCISVARGPADFLYWPSYLALFCCVRVRFLPESQNAHFTSTFRDF